MNEHAKQIQKPRCFLVYALAPADLPPAEANRILNNFVGDKGLPLPVYHDHFIGQPGGVAIFFVDTKEARDALLNQKHLEGWQVEYQPQKEERRSYGNPIFEVETAEVNEGRD